MPVCMPVGLRVLRGLGRGFAILVLAAVLRFFLFQVVVSGSKKNRLELMVQICGMDIAATVSETARGLLISPAPRTNRM